MLNHSILLKYALHNGSLKYIHDVENGIKCNCICPACKKPLIAKNNTQKKESHFAHYKNLDCKYGYQTNIHIWAKELLREKKQLLLPQVSTVDIADSYKNSIEYNKYLKKKVSEPKEIKVDKVVLEKKLHSFIPDVVIFSGNKKLIVEIAVTHFIGREKNNKIAESKISTLEINLSKIGEPINKDILKQLLFDHKFYKWIHNEFALKNLRKILPIAQLKKESKKSVKKLRSEHDKKFELNVTLKDIGSFMPLSIPEKCPVPKMKKNNYHFSTIKNCVDCEHFVRFIDNKNKVICYYSNKNKYAKRKNSYL